MGFGSHLCRGHQGEGQGAVGWHGHVEPASTGAVKGFDGGLGDFPVEVLSQHWGECWPILGPTWGFKNPSRGGRGGVIAPLQGRNSSPSLVSVYFGERWSFFPFGPGRGGGWGLAGGHLAENVIFKGAAGSLQSPPGEGPSGHPGVDPWRCLGNRGLCAWVPG